MRVLYDSSIFSRQIFGGISRYIVSLINNLPSGVGYELSLKVSANSYLHELHPPLRVPTLRRIPERAKLSRYINHIADRRALRRGDFDVLHPTDYDPWYIGLTDKPVVVTVHDMIHEYDGGRWCPKVEQRRNIRRVIESATRLIAISRHTRDELIRLYGIAEDKIDVVYHGFAPSFETPRRLPDIPERYILYVGERGGYKNFGRSLEAFALLAEEYPDLQMVCTGRPFRTDEKEEIKSLHLDQRVIQKFVASEDMHSLYAGAELFIFPSYYEGFGLPVLEAFAADTPVALSRSSCLPEIGGDGAAYFNPHDAEDIARVVRKILNDKEYSSSLVEAGRERLKAFSWQQTALATAEVYKKAIAQSMFEFIPNRQL